MRNGDRRSMGFRLDSMIHSQLLEKTGYPPGGKSEWRGCAQKKGSSSRMELVFSTPCCLMLRFDLESRTILYGLPVQGVVTETRENGSPLKGRDKGETLCNCGTLFFEYDGVTPSPAMLYSGGGWGQLHTFVFEADFSLSSCPDSVDRVCRHPRKSIKVYSNLGHERSSRPYAELCQHQVCSGVIEAQTGAMELGNSEEARDNRSDINICILALE